MRRRLALALALSLLALPTAEARTAKPVLHGRHWVAITGKPLAATAGAMIFLKGGNAVDAACAMLGATTTMWDTLGWGGETQALVWNPRTKQVMAVNALGVAPSGATADFYRGKGMRYPPEFGALAAVTPGTPGGLMTMLAEWGKLSLGEVLAPAIEMADQGYPIEEELVRVIGRGSGQMNDWPFSKALFLPLDGKPPEMGSLFRQKDLAATLKRLVDAEQAARKAGRDRKAAILAANDLFYRGAIARELADAAREAGGLITADDLARWKPKIEKPVSTNYKGIDVYKLTTWTQGPAMLQALNMLERADLKGMGYNSARYIHTVTQAMHLAFTDRDFYYGDPDFPPDEPVRGLLSKEYARKRWEGFDPKHNRAEVKPGDPYPFQDGTNPFSDLLAAWPPAPDKKAESAGSSAAILASRAGGGRMTADEAFRAGTTSVIAADAEGWVVSMTPSGAWVPAVVAGHSGIGLSQRAQSFVLDRRENPFNVIAPGQRPRVTLTPSLALRDGKPFLVFGTPGSDTQPQTQLQFFLNVAEFGMPVQQALEQPAVISNSFRDSYAPHAVLGKLITPAMLAQSVRDGLAAKGHKLDVRDAKGVGSVKGIMIDPRTGVLHGGVSPTGDSYVMAW